MLKKFEINQTKIKGGCLSERKVVTHNSKSDLAPDFVCLLILTNYDGTDDSDDADKF